MSLLVILLLCLARTSRTIFSRSGKNGLLRLVSDFRGKALSLSLPNMTLVVNF